MSLAGRLILLRMGPVWNLVKEDTRPKLILCIRRVLYEAAGWTDIAEDGTDGESL